MRSFEDSNKCEWTVFEVRRQAPKGDGAYLPSGYSDGWLCFENSTSKRRLVKYPARWKELPDSELEKLLSQATPAPRASLRLGDLADPGAAADVHAG